MAWLERLFAKLNRKLTPTAAAMGGSQNEAAIMASEVAREEEEETEGQEP